jgi:hypothetical protein
MLPIAADAVALFGNLDKSSGGARVRANGRVPCCEDTAEGLQFGVLTPRCFHGGDRIGAAEPYQRGAHEAGPVLETRQRRQLARTPRGKICPNDRQRCGDVRAPVAEHGVDRVELELAQFRALHLRVQRAEHYAPDNVADQHQVIAVGKDRCLTFDGDQIANAERANLNDRTLDQLTQKVAAQFTIEVVDRHQGLAGQQRRAEPLLEFEFIEPR